MNEEAQNQLDAILSKDPNALTDEERSVLNARRSYLTEAQLIDFGISELAAAAPTSAENANDPPKSGKKSGKKSDE